MDEDSLYEFGFNRDTRKLIKVTMEDAFYAKDMLDKIMGDDTSYRKDILSEYSVYDLDDE